MGITYNSKKRGTPDDVVPNTRIEEYRQFADRQKRKIAMPGAES